MNKQELIEKAKRDAATYVEQADIWYNTIMELSASTGPEEVLKRAQDILFSESKSSDLVLDLMAFSFLNHAMANAMGGEPRLPFLDSKAVKEKSSRVMAVCRDIAVAHNAYNWIKKNLKEGK